MNKTWIVLKNVWNKIKEILSSVDFWKVLIPAAMAIFIWSAKQGEKIRWEQYQRKEERYVKLLESVKGFYSGTENPKDKRNAFLHQLDLCWLYCPDEVIEKAYYFLDLQNDEIIPKYPKEELEKLQKTSLQELVLTLRKDLVKRKRLTKTKLEKEDFQILKVK